MHLITNYFLFIRDKLFLVVNDPLYVFMQMHNMLIYCDRYTCKQVFINLSRAQRGHL